MESGPLDYCGKIVKNSWTISELKNLNYRFEQYIYLPDCEGRYVEDDSHRQPPCSHLLDVEPKKIMMKEGLNSSKGVTIYLRCDRISTF